MSRKSFQDKFEICKNRMATCKEQNGDIESVATGQVSEPCNSDVVAAGGDNGQVEDLDGHTSRSICNGQEHQRKTCSPQAQTRHQLTAGFSLGTWHVLLHLPLQLQVGNKRGNLPRHTEHQGINATEMEFKPRKVPSVRCKLLVESGLSAEAAL